VSLSRPWKALERRIAKLLGGERIWRQDFSEVAPDVVTEFETVDCKCYKRFSVVEMFVRRERDYRAYTAGRRFVLALFSRDHPKAGDFILIRARDYAELKRKAGEL
jgi:hypothetical protein